MSLGRVARIAAPRVTLLRPDPAAAQALANVLERAGCRVTVVPPGGVAGALNTADRTDVVLVDLDLTEVNGLDVITWFERTSCAIVALHGPEREADRVLALELGADDVVGAECPAQELIARVRSVHRRFAGRPSLERLAYGALCIDLVRGVALHAGERLKLTSAEFKVLELLATHSGQIVSRDTLSEAALRRPWRPDDRSVDQLVFSLRQKLPLQDDGAALIQTVRCGGYRMRAPDSMPGKIMMPERVLQDA